MPQTRTRNKSVTLRMTDAEYALFETNFHKSKSKSQTDFFLECLNSKPIIVIENLKPTLIELKRQGVNLNQISKYLNQAGPLTDEIKSLILDCNATYKKLLDMELNANATL